MCLVTEPEVHRFNMIDDKVCVFVCMCVRFRLGPDREAAGGRDFGQEGPGRLVQTHQEPGEADQEPDPGEGGPAQGTLHTPQPHSLSKA